VTWLGGLREWDLPGQSQDPVRAHEHPVRELNPGYAALGTRLYGSTPVRTGLVDSNSTRTESYVAIRPDPEARIQVDAPKTVDHNGCQQINRPSRGMRAGLKTQKATARETFGWNTLRSLGGTIPSADRM